MTPYERVFKRLGGKEVDRVPNLNIVMTFAAKLIGVPYRKFVTDYRSLVRGNIACCQRFGIDMVSAVSDPAREGYDLGAEVILPEDDVPYFGEPLLNEYSLIRDLEVKDPLKSERMLDRIKAVELYKKEVGGEYPILGWVEGAFAEAADLRGINNIMLDLYESPDFVHQLLEICTEQAIKFAREQIKAGADFIGVGDAAASLIGPVNYKKFALPYQKRVIDAVHVEGARVKLHICGNITSILDIVGESGADMIDVDWMVNFGRAVEALEGIAVAGNYNPVEVLLRGTAAEVKQAVDDCLDVGNNQTFSAAGCEVPRETPPENLAAVTERLKEREL